jgi:hypothetical protein
MAQISHDELLGHLKVLVSEACSAGRVEGQVNGEGVTVKLSYGRSDAGDLDLAKRVAALLAQEVA